MTYEYTETSLATAAYLKPKARLYVCKENIIVVARIGSADDWAAYWGSDEMELDWVADYGLKLPEAEARMLFPICADLEYRY